MAITPLPEEPKVTDTQADFNSKAFNWVAALGTFVTEANAQAVEVNGYATAAADSATAAADSVTAAENYATAAADSATAAADSVTAAENYATASADSATLADTLTEHFQGSLSADPSLDRHGNPLTDGDWYINSTTGVVRVYTGSAWVNGLSGSAGVMSFNGQTGDVTYLPTTSVTLGEDVSALSLLMAQGNDGAVKAAKNSNFISAESVFNSASTNYLSITALDSTHVVVAYSDVGNKNYGTAVVGTVSGTSISFGAELVFNSASTNYISVTAVDSTHVVVAYRDGGNSNYGTAVVGTISGTSISFGAESVFNSAITNYISVTAVDSTHVVVAYRDVGNSNYGTAVVGTVSGTSISFGAESVFNSATTSDISVTTVDSTHVVVAYRDAGNSNYGTAVVGTVSGTSISFGAESVFNSANTSYISVTTVDSTHVVVAYCDEGNSNYGTAVLFSSIINAIIGINAVAGSSSSVINVYSPGMVIDGLTGLTPGIYYVDPTTGVLSTTATIFSFLQSPLKAGVALSATEFLVQPDRLWL